MREYDYILIGTGSAMNIAAALLRKDPHVKLAVIDKDKPGGICLTRGCIPSKILIYHAELVREIQRAKDFGIDAELKGVDFNRAMERMRSLINKDIDAIRDGLSNSNNVDYYPQIAEFLSPYTLKIGEETITSKTIFLCTGSKPAIPPIKGLEQTGYLTSDTLLELEKLPKSIAIIGGGYIAAEYGNFLSAMGSKVTIIGRNPRLLPDEEPEISLVAKKEMETYLEVLTGYEVKETQKTPEGKKLLATSIETGKTKEIIAEEILVAAGRAPNTDLLHPEKGGVKIDKNGWIIVNEYLETSQPGVWAFGDATGRQMFKHKANYESAVVFHNAILKKRMEADYHAVPHAIFTSPEIASVGMNEKEAAEKHGQENVLIGFHRYQDTAKGEAMGLKDHFAKVIVEAKTFRILGAHIIGPQASVLIQEIVNLMNTPEQSARPATSGMHIHPALSEVVMRAFESLGPVADYHHLLKHHFKLD